MKCEIIRDLIPSYIDGLTSNESNSEIKLHLETCDECREFHDQMKLDLKHEPIPAEKDKIKPFKKLNKRVKQSIAATLIVCLAAAGIYIYLCFIGWGVNSDEMNIMYSYKDGTVYLDFELQNDHSLIPWTNRRINEEEYISIISLRQSYNTPLDDRGEFPNTFSFGMGCLDDKGNLILLDNTIIQIEYKDKTETIYVKDLFEQYGEKSDSGN